MIESDDALILLKIQEPRPDALKDNSNEKTAGVAAAQRQGAFFAIVPEAGWSQFKAASERRSVKP